MEREYTFKFDERVDYAFDCQKLLYEFLKRHIELFVDQVDYRLLDYRLKSESLAKEDIELALGCIERRIRSSTQI